MTTGDVGHQLTIAPSSLGTRVACTCGWLFVSPSDVKAGRAARVHLEEHEPRLAPSPEARTATVREMAIAAVEVNHLSRYTHVHAEDVAEDVDAVLRLVAEHYGRSR